MSAPKKESVVSKKVEGKEALMVSRKKVKRVLLARKKPLFVLPTNMCFHVSSPMFNFPIGFGEMVEGFKELFPKNIPKGLPPIRGIENYIYFTLGATLPNRDAYRENHKVNEEIQQQVGKLVEND
ncbi:hypothetical protein CR513_38045, partial [Mucuna pruriens]